MRCMLAVIMFVCNDAKIKGYECFLSIVVNSNFGEAVLDFSRTYCL